MSLINNAKYHFGFEFLRIMAANPDLTPPSPSRIVGGIGPFDYSGAAVPAAVDLFIKIDGALDSVVAIDLSGVGAIGAVTVAELFAAINTAAYTNITASQEAGTTRLLIVAGSGSCKNTVYHLPRAGFVIAVRKVLGDEILEARVL